jgi:protein TonB
LVASAPLIMIDLAPVAAAPTVVPNDMPPDVVKSKLVEPASEPEPEKPLEKIELPPDPAPQPELTATPPPKPPEKKVEKKKPRQRTASTARAASSADVQAERAAAPMSGANARDSSAIPNWRSQLVARLERNKRYPADAQARGETGTVQLAFTVDRNGGAHSVRLVRSSGSSALDRETLTLIDRAAPFPPPPPELGGGQIAIVVPIRYLPPR